MLGNNTPQAQSSTAFAGQSFFAGTEPTSTVQAAVAIESENDSIATGSNVISGSFNQETRTMEFTTENERHQLSTCTTEFTAAGKVEVSTLAICDQQGRLLELIETKFEPDGRCARSINTMFGPNGKPVKLTETVLVLGLRSQQSTVTLFGLGFKSQQSTVTTFDREGAAQQSTAIAFDTAGRRRQSIVTRFDRTGRSIGSKET